MSTVETSVKVIPLGGLEQIGMNMTVFEYGESIIVVDCGMSFPGDEMLGIDMVIPDITYLKQNIHKVKGVFITHGHEDHIGALPFFFKEINVPLYGTKLTLGIIEGKLEEHGITKSVKRKVVKYGQTISAGDFKVEFIRTNHSIVDAAALAITSPAGTIIHTGDFKIDYTPVFGDMADLQRFAELGKKGVLALLCDSTNALRPGFTASERTVGHTFDTIFSEHRNQRIIVATFASNIHRVQQIVEAAVKFNRKILVYGRSMVNNIDVARKMGYIKCPDRFFIKNDEAKHLHDNEILILCTGSQGEALAALNRIANGTHRQIKIKPGDTVLFSSNPIPGNQSSVSRLINKLYRSGARVLENSMISNLHTSGHASQEEQKLMMLLTKPKYFFPVHGEHKMLCIHKKLYEEVGGKPDHAFVLSNGDCLCLKDHEVFQTRSVHADDIYVDGNDLTGLSTAVLHDRQILSEDGMVAVLISMDSHAGILLHKPVIMSRGFVYMKDSKPMIYGAEMAVDRKLRALLQEKTTFGEIKNTIRETLTSYFYTKTKRRPMIIPVIMNKK